MTTTQSARDLARSDSIAKAARAIMPPDNQPAAYPSPVLTKAVGAVVTDADGNDYIDYAGTTGAMILGHADGRVTVAINKAAAKGLALGAPTELQVRLAEIIASRFPAVDQVRFVNSTADARSAAIDCAQLHTQRERVLAYTQCGGRRCDPSPLRLNDAAALERAFEEDGPSIAAVIVEPVAINGGLVAADRGFLTSVRSLCDEHGAALIFDESATAFRLPATVDRPWAHVAADLTVIGCTVGGGLPLAAFGGRRSVIQSAPLRPATAGFEAMPGLPLAVAAGLGALEAMAEPGFYENLDTLSSRLDEGLRAAAASTDVPTRHARFANMVGLYFTQTSCEDPTFASSLSDAYFGGFREAMLDRGVLVPASPAACYHVSAAHTVEQIDQTIQAAHEALQLTASSS